MTITNPHDTVTVLSVSATWNKVGGPAGKPMTLKTISLGGNFWTGSDSSGSISFQPTGMTIPGNNRTSTIIFTFDNNYVTTTGSSITITLSTPGCEGVTIQNLP